MPQRIIVAGAAADEVFEADRLPLSIGGSETDALRVPVTASGVAAASIGLLDEDAFIQAGPAGQTVLLNGQTLSGPKRLADGDRIEVGGRTISCTLRGDALRLELVVPESPPETRQASPHPEVIAPTPFRPSGRSAKPPPRRYARTSVILTWLVGSVLLALVWFSFTAVSVRLAFEPVPDEVRLPGTFLRFHIGDRYLLRPGSHAVLAEKEGYFPLRERIEVDEAPDQRFAFVLIRLPGRLAIETSPAEGVRLSIDGRAVGTTPLGALELQAGPHSVTLEAPHHLPEEHEIEIEGGGLEQRLEVELVPAWAPVTLESVPSGATVLVDGVEVGTTPGTFEVDAGTRRLELHLVGYNVWRDEVEVEADRPQALEPIALVQADGTLRIVSNPPGAQVVVGDASPGRTPLLLPLASGQAHRISLFKSGYELSTRTVELQPAEERRLEIRLEPRVGVVELVTTPSGASLTVDGKPSGTASQTLRLLAIPHLLVIRKQGYREERLTVTPRPDFAQRVELELDPIGGGSSASRVVETPLGGKLRLVDPGSFVMGSPSGEPGRRRNEVERPVVLTRPFYIGVTEVTNAEFREFAPAHAPPVLAGFDLGGDDQPVAGVTWEQAAAFCNWLSRKEGLPPAYAERDGSLELRVPVGTGYRLPTEAEWAWAARFAGGVSGSRFPWGDDPDPPRGSGNYADAAAAGIVPSALLGYRDGFVVSAPVGSNGANALGLADVGGNVAEWVNDRYMLYVNAANQPPVEDPLGPRTGGLRVIRGSSWRHASPTQLRLAYRDYGKEAREDVGFRLARYAR